MSEAEKARMERDKLRQREQERRRREAQVSKYFQPPSNFFISNSEYFFILHFEIITTLTFTLYFQQNQIDMNRQSDMMAAFEENII